MTTQKERVTVLVSKARKRDLMELLKKVDFIKVETLEQTLEVFIENAPTEAVPLTEDDIQREINAYRRSRQLLTEGNIL